MAKANGNAVVGSSRRMKSNYFKRAVITFCLSSVASFLVASVLLADYFVRRSSPSIRSLPDAPLEEHGSFSQQSKNRQPDFSVDSGSWRTCEIRLRKIPKPDVRSLTSPKLLRHIRTRVLVHLGENKKGSNSRLHSDAAVAAAAGSGNSVVVGEDPSEGQFMSKLIVPKFFSNKSMVYERKFFEAGALDGKFASTTFYLENTLGWTGMLAEANPLKVPEIVNKSGRGVWLAPVCLSPETRPCKGTYGVAHSKNTSGGGIPNDVLWFGKLLSPGRRRTAVDDGWAVYTAPVDCYPLFSLLASAGLTRIDFLSLDVESIEPHVLKTIPWDAFHAKVIRLDLHAGRTYARYKAFAIDFLRTIGYRFHTELLNNPYVGVNDAHIFSRIDMVLQ